MSDYISHDHEHDGIDRRGFLKCMAWAGTGVLWTVSGALDGKRRRACVKDPRSNCKVWVVIAQG